MTLSVFMCVRRREADENQNYIYPKLINVPIVEIYIYTSQDRYVVHFFLHFLYCHIIVILFFSNGIKTCIYIQVNTNTCMSYISVYTFCVVNIFVIGLLFLCKGIKTCKYIIPILKWYAFFSRVTIVGHTTALPPPLPHHLHQCTCKF